MKRHMIETVNAIFHLSDLTRAKLERMMLLKDRDFQTLH
jgi:hypothetical protein